MNLADVKVFRMTHIDNIPHILQNGITHRNSPNANPNYTPIGDNSLISVRNSKNIKASNGIGICLGDFIPFYFWVRMPMLYVIQKGYNNVPKTNPEEIVYLVCSVEDLTKNDQEIYFSNGHATNKLSSLYDKSELNNLVSILDRTSIKSNDWGGSENTDLKRRKEAEFLIKNDVKPEFILGFGCYNENVKQKLISFGIDTNKIKIISNAYF